MITKFIYLFRTENIKMLRYLIKNRADVNAVKADSDEDTALIVAVKNGNYSIPTELELHPNWRDMNTGIAIIRLFIFMF